MAHPISLELPRSDPRVALHARLAAAPAEHAEAMLAAYEVLQGLQDKGVFDLLRGLLGASDEVLGITVVAAGSPEAIRGIRNLVELVKLLGAIEPDALRVWTRTIPRAMKTMAEPTESIGIWKLLKQFRNEDVRRGIAAVNKLLETLGKELSAAPHTSGPSSPPTA